MLEISFPVLSAKIIDHICDLDFSFLCVFGFGGNCPHVLKAKKVKQLEMCKIEDELLLL